MKTGCKRCVETQKGKSCGMNIALNQYVTNGFILTKHNNMFIFWTAPQLLAYRFPKKINRRVLSDGFNDAFSLFLFNDVVFSMEFFPQCAVGTSLTVYFYQFLELLVFFVAFGKGPLHHHLDPIVLNCFNRFNIKKITTSPSVLTELLPHAVCR